MKLAALFISLIVLINLSLELVSSASSNEQTLQSEYEVIAHIPKLLPKHLLVLEEKWQKIQQETAEPQKTDSKKVQKNNYALTIGNNNYLLLGIFKERENNFVLLKDNEDKIIKLKQHDNLPGGYSLAEINSNSIAFVFNDERVEYKLFEQKSHDKN